MSLSYTRSFSKRLHYSSAIPMPLHQIRECFFERATPVSIGFTLEGDWFLEPTAPAAIATAGSECGERTPQNTDITCNPAKVQFTLASRMCDDYSQLAPLP